jgi:hypothetical protein
MTSVLTVHVGKKGLVLYYTTIWRGSVIMMTSLLEMHLHTIYYTYIHIHRV